MLRVSRTLAERGTAVAAFLEGAPLSLAFLFGLLSAAAAVVVVSAARASRHHLGSGVVIDDGEIEQLSPEHEPPPFPKGWGDDDLSSFIEMARNNTLATFQNLTSEYQLVRDIDSVFHGLATHLDNPPDQRVPFFVYLSHGAFRAAARLAMSGQLPPTYMTLRGCLEFGLYGHFIHCHPENFEVWTARGEDAASRKAVQKMFTASAVLGCLAEQSKHDGKVARALYDRCIDLGAHPNEGSLFSSLTVEETEEAVEFEVAYLHGHGVPLDLALKTLSQVGVCSLRMFRLVFPERFDLLGLGQRLDHVSKYV